MLNQIKKIFLGTFISRIFGFFREQIVAAYFGTGKIADAFILAQTFPTIFRQILGEDMVERAFMPPFKTIYDKGDKNKAWDFLSVTLNWFFFSLLFITTVLYIVIPLFFSMKDSFPQVFGLIFSSKEFDYDYTLNLILIMLPFMIFIGLAAFLGSLLNFFGKNWIFGFAPIMLSVGLIIGIVFLEPIIGGYSLAVGWVLGAFLQFLIQIPFIFNKKFKKETELNYKITKLSDENNDFSTIKRESKIITLNATFNKSSEIFSKFFAATLITGATSSLSYAMRLYNLPIGIISLSITRGINPELNKMVAKKDYSGFNKIFTKGINLYLLIIIPFTLIMMISSNEIVNIAFKWGKFDLNSLRLTSDALIMYSIGIFPISMVGYYTRVLSLFNKNKYALFVSIVSASANIIFALLLVNFTDLQHSGIALASTIAFFINFLLLDRFLKRDLKEYLSQAEKKVSSFSILNKIIIVGIMVLLFSLNYHYKTDFYDTKFISIISLFVKSLSVFTIYGLFYISNKNLKKVLKEVV